MKVNYATCLRSLLLKTLLMFSLSLCWWFSGFTQNVIEDISEINPRNYKEEIYLQTDRDLYIVGEQVLFKVYKINGLSYKPNNVSKVVYLELLNSAGYPVTQIKLNVDGKSGSASFGLSDTISSGNYLLRAYTKWMKNYSEKDFSFKPISIINPFHSPEKIKIPSKKQVIDTILFYPEGGVLVSGNESKVGFRAIDKSGRPISIDAAIVNENMDTICLVSNENTGFGTFSFKPNHRENYRLLCSTDNIGELDFPLGKIESSGIALSLYHTDLYSPFKVKIHKSSGVNPGNSSYFILVLSNGLVKFMKEINLNREIEIIISREELPKGISEIVLVNDNGEQLCNRWIYNEFENSISLDVKLDQQEYRSREKVKVEIIATDKEGEPIDANLTVSIAKSCTVNETRANINNRYKHISSLRTELKTSEISDINDFLLCYSGDDFDLIKSMGASKVFPQYLPEFEGVILSGNLRNGTTNIPVGNTKVLFSFVDSIAKCQVYETNDSGDFHFVIDETGLQEIVIQPVDFTLSDFEIVLRSDFSNSFDHFFPGTFYLDITELEELNSSIINMQIENIYKPYRKPSSHVTASSDLYSFYGDPEHSVEISDFIKLTTIREVIKEIVPHVQTRQLDGKSYIKIVSDIDGQIFENNPLVIVDGIPFNDIDQILSMNSAEMRRIEVINRRYFIDDHVFDGIIHFITKKGNLEALDFDHSIFRQAYNAFYQEVKFNSPDYSNETLKNSPLPDYRNTLYWNPDLQTKNNGVVGFEFYTSDETSDYTIFVEGISQDGKTGAISKRLVVN